MFSNNDMISVRQLKRQMVLSFIGILLLDGTKEAAVGGGNGILGFVLGSVLLAAYLFLLVKTAEVYSEPKRYLGSPGTWILKGVCLSFLALTGGVLAEESSLVIQTYLLPAVPGPVISALLLAAAFLGMGQNIQRRGRLAEVSYPWILGILLLLLALALPHFRGVSLDGMAPLDAAEISRGTIRVFASGTAVSLVPFILGRVREPEKSFRVLRRGIWLLLLIGLGSALILAGVYGWKGVRQLEYPMLNLMTGTDIPGGFLGRVDIIWLAVLLFALLFAMGSILFYGAFICRSAAGGFPWTRLILAAAVWLFSFIRWDGTAVSDIYYRLLQDIYAPVFLGLALLAVWAKRRAGNESPKKKN